MENVILVNEHDHVLGLMEKMEAHEKGLLHRAFSVFVVNEHGELMLQQRALSKYHSGGLWTNTCCSHPREGESYEQAAHRRLVEEMGFDCALEDIHHFIYHAYLDKGLQEHELDHVFLGTYSAEPQINPDEVASWKWMALEEVQQDLQANPQLYTAWFKIIFETFYTIYLQRK